MKSMANLKGRGKGTPRNVPAGSRIARWNWFRSE
jgi:hypothetical protein